MSRTDLDATTLANSLRMRAGDGSIEWVSEPIQASVLLDIADMLDENAKLRDERERLFRANVEKNGEILRLLEENARLKQELEAVGTAAYLYGRTDLADENAKLRELVQDYDAMLAIAAKKEAATSIILPLDAVVNALRIRAGLLGIEVDE